MVRWEKLQQINPRRQRSCVSLFSKQKSLTHMSPFFKDLILGVWKYAQMHKNTFSTNSDVKIVFFKDLILFPWKCIKTRFEPLRMLKNNFLKTWFWWSGSTHKCIKTRFLPLQTLKKSFLRTWFWWPGNASKHVFNHSRRWEISFLRTWFWWPGNASKHVFNHSRRWKISFLRTWI